MVKRARHRKHMGKEGGDKRILGKESVAKNPALSEDPVNMMCPKCGRQIKTEVRDAPGPGAWIAGVVLCLV